MKKFWVIGLILLSGSYPVLSDSSGENTSIDKITQEALSSKGSPDVLIWGPDTVCGNETIFLEVSDSVFNQGNDFHFYWDLGDGTKAEGKKVRKRYQKAGDYHVVLKAKQHSTTTPETTVEKDIHIENPPMAKVEEDASICLGDGLEFDGSASQRKESEILLSEWDFGDGTKEGGLKVHHIYQNPGTYTARLTVKNAFILQCPQSTAKRKVVVHACDSPHY